ncbi:glycosyltransferase [Actinomadura flavalba]|uniref:glycosyltransferase n=1 Tax=Actinomadura flavalba TaxID=1120938 RepID=UPI001F0A35C2|nr:glycosyltransferase [Actinomadura flavalba]
MHIAQMADELFTRFDGGLLAVLGGGGLPDYQREGGREIARFAAAVPNLIDRAEAFSGWVGRHLDAHRDTLELVHVRDPWGALPALAGNAPVVFEVNGLPSIEMTHTWPWAAPAALAKIRDLELDCLERSAAVVVPSRVIGDRLRALGVPGDKIHLVPNGATPNAPAARPAGAPARYLVYVGALQPWQGLDVLLRAFARLADLTDLRLVVCASVPERRAKPLRRLAERLGVADRVDWRFTLPHHEVAGWLTHAEVSVAPLTGCARNVEQGCAPLKVIESMAAGVPVVASDLPVVRELMAGEHGRLVPPDRPAELARAIRILLEYPDMAREMGARGRDHVRSTLTWTRARARLSDVYRTVLARR